MRQNKLIFRLSMISAVLVMFESATLAQSSSVTIDASQNMTNLKFTDSRGEVDDSYNPAYSGSYKLGYRYNTDFGLFVGVKLGMRNAGASLVYDEANYSWDFQYADARLDIGYMYSFDKLGVYLAVSPYFGYMLRATQTLNHKDFDIINSEDLEKVDYGLFISPGVNFEINEYMSVYSQFNYMLGLQNLETVEGQDSRNTLLGLSLGLAFNIK